MESSGQRSGVLAEAHGDLGVVGPTYSPECYPPGRVLRVRLCWEFEEPEGPKVVMLTLCAGIRAHNLWAVAFRL